MLTRFYRFGQVAGVAIHIGQDGGFVMDGCLLELKGDDLSVLKKFGGLTDLNDLKKHLPEGTMVALNISGKGILTKQLAGTDGDHGTEMARAFPNTDPEAFDLQHAGMAEQVFLSLIRKTEAERWSNQFEALGLIPVSLSLGPFAVMQIDGELNVPGDELIFNGHIITRDVGKAWTGQRYLSGANAGHQLLLYQEAISENMILPYAVAFQLLLDSQLQRISAPSRPFEELLKSRSALRKLKVNAVAVLFAVFGLLLINFGIFSWLSSANDRLTDQLSRVQQSSTDIRTTIDQVKRTEELLKTLGWDGDVLKAKLVDQLAALLPADVHWTAVQVNPVKNVRGQGADQIGFETNTIRITGTADKVLSVNEWLARIKVRSWVQRAQLNTYSFDNAQNTGVFNLTITY